LKFGLLVSAIVQKNVYQILAKSRRTGSNWFKVAAGLTAPAKIFIRPLLVFIEGSFASASGTRHFWPDSVSVNGDSPASKLPRAHGSGSIVYLIACYDEVER
jgi:hypothetical protein